MDLPPFLSAGMNAGLLFTAYQNWSILGTILQEPTDEVVPVDLFADDRRFIVFYTT